MLPSAKDLVARFLKANGYNQTLSTFIKEAGLPPDAGTVKSSHVTIEQILQEKKMFDLSLNFEKLGKDDYERVWHSPAPSQPHVLSSLPTRSNILSVTLLSCLLPALTEPKPYLAVTTADRHLHLLDASVPSLPLALTHTDFLDSPALEVLVVKQRYLLVAAMSGKLTLYDTSNARVLDSRKDHAKYLVRLSAWSNDSCTIIVSAGWDAKIFLYSLARDGPSGVRLGAPFASMTLPSVPETLSIIQSPDSLQPVILLTRRDSTFLYYYTMPTSDSSGPIRLLGKQNLAPHSTAWVAFTPSDVQVSPVDPSLVAVATSSTPHMKLQVVRLLIPPEEEESNTDHSAHQESPTQASQARQDLWLQDKEEAAILVNVSTMAPQTAYSTPRLVWRPDGSGVYVTSDDGVVRGFEVATGKLTANLQAHNAGTKLRCLWAGRLQVASGDSNNTMRDEEHLVSGGFDQKLILWNMS